MNNLSTTKKIVIGILAIFAISVAATMIHSQIRYEKEVERIDQEHKEKMNELRELENMYKYGNSYEKQKAYEELREKCLREGIPIDE